MRRTLALTVTLALLTSVTAALAASPFKSVPAGSLVRVTLGSGETLRGSLVRAGAESLQVETGRGSRVVHVSNGAVQSLAWKSGSRPSARKDVLLGIAAGAAGGATLGALLGGQGEGGEGGGTRAGGDDVANAIHASLATAATTTQATSSASYRGVVGAVIGGVAGGILAGMLRPGMGEAVWSTVPGPGAHTYGVPAAAAPAVFAVRLPLRFGARR